MSDAGPETVRVDLGERGYDILVGRDLIAGAGAGAGPALAAVLRRPRAVVVTDATVAGLWLEPLNAALDAAGVAHEAVILPPGEGSKDFAHLEDLVDRLLAARIERRDAVIALGGGVVGDLAGFAAAVVLRGVDFVQVPTTLLAQVDSSVGGKTGINTRRGKNLVGAFHQPRLVLADTAALDTLDRRQRLAGYAEVVKYGLIDRPEFLAWLEDNGAAVVDGDPDARRHAVATSCRAKAAIVAADEREGGRRALLNLGHTFGHALEAETGFGDALLHGEAVALGMVMALDLSARLGLSPAPDADRLRRHLRAVGLAAGLEDLAPRDWDPDRLIAHMGHDKKVAEGRPAFVLCRGAGAAFLTRDVPPMDLHAVLADHCRAGRGGGV